MRRSLLGLLTLLGLGAAVALSGALSEPAKTFFPRAERNPVTQLAWNDAPADFAFALVSDRTGGHRPEVFSRAVAKLNLLQPAFVLSVGDLIEGGKSAEALKGQWKEFDGFVNRLEMPFFYVAGNHDVGTAESAKFWAAKHGRRHYHFRYRDVLFLALNSDDPPGVGGAINADQRADVRRALDANRDVRWTVVLVHRPLWTANDGKSNGWREVELALAGRPYTVFAGHVHRYQKFVRQGMNYYQLATTGGSSLVRGVDQGEFDQIAWVTMKASGPVLANLLLDAIQTEDLRPIPTDEPGVKRTHQAVHPVRGKIYFDGTPMPGAQIILHKAGEKGARAVGIAAADGSFQLSTYRANDGAPAGEYQVSVIWRGAARGAKSESLLPKRYSSGATSGLTAAIRPGENELVLELHK